MAKAKRKTLSTSFETKKPSEIIVPKSRGAIFFGWLRRTLSSWAKQEMFRVRIEAHDFETQRQSQSARERMDYLQKF